MSRDDRATVAGWRSSFGSRPPWSGVDRPGRFCSPTSRSSHVRDQAGLEIGASYEVEIALDSVARTIEVPEDLAAALATDPTARAAFTALAYSHRTEFVRWITEAKQEATRADRVVKTLELVRAGRTR